MNSGYLVKSHATSKIKMLLNVTNEQTIIPVQKSPSAVLAVALKALQGRQFPAYYALTGRVLDDIGDVQVLGGQDAVVHLVLLSEPWHL